jgi:RNA polymerase sigma-70 factor (ECF subfamily)
LTEQELIHQLKQGDEPAFRWLVENYRNRVFASVLNILQDTKEAEDAAQETFIQAYESIGAFKEEATLATWIYRIAVRKALDKLRRRKRRQRLHTILPWWMPEESKHKNEAFEHPGVLVENKEKAAILFKAITALPEKQRLAFTLIKVQGMSYEDTCAIMEQSVKAVESLVSRAKANLQNSLANYYKTVK